MNVLGGENQEILQCNNCILITTVIKTKVYYSKICLHRICEPCIKKIFTVQTPVQSCKFCGKNHEIKDYSEKTRDEIYYELDYRARHKVMAVYYKRLEDFENEEEYEDYLEEVEEKLIESQNIEELIKELEAKMPKPKLNMNHVKIREEINLLNSLARDPKRMYDVEAESVEEQFSTMQVTDTERKIRPAIPTSLRALNVKFPTLKEDAKITIKRDNNLKIKAGGYNFDKVYSDLAEYSNLGLI